MQKFEVEFYEKSNGRMPAREYLLGLNTKMRAKIASTISLLADNGYELREPYSKHLFDGIFELRSSVGNNASRVLYFFYIDNRIILTNGFTKKTNKTPKSEIEKALRYRNDYFNRKESAKDEREI